MPNRTCAASPWIPTSLAHHPHRGHRPASQHSQRSNYPRSSFHSQRSSSVVRTSYSMTSLDASFIQGERRKLVVVGDGECGKTSLLMVHAQGVFPTEYTPTVFETHQSVVWLNKDLVEGRRPRWKQKLNLFRTKLTSLFRSSIKSKERDEDDWEETHLPVSLSLWDTAGQEDYDRLRPLSYTDVHVLLICFSVCHPASLVNVRVKWHPELDCFCPGVARILVGLKGDQREQDPSQCIPVDQVCFYCANGWHKCVSSLKPWRELSVQIDIWNALLEMPKAFLRFSSMQRCYRFRPRINHLDRKNPNILRDISVIPTPYPCILIPSYKVNAYTHFGSIAICILHFSMTKIKVLVPLCFISCLSISFYRSRH